MLETTWRNDNVKDCWVSDEMREWEKNAGGGWKRIWGRQPTDYPD